MAGLKDVITGDTLCDEKAPVLLERMEFPDPVIKVAIEPKTKGDQDKMTNGLIKLAQEDPSFHFRCGARARARGAAACAAAAALPGVRGWRMPRAPPHHALQPRRGDKPDCD